MSQAEQVAQAIGARAYKECSALLNEGVDEIFEAATRAAMLVRSAGVTASERERVKRRTSEKDEVNEGSGKGCGCVIV